MFINEFMEFLSAITPTEETTDDERLSDEAIIDRITDEFIELQDCVKKAVCLFGQAREAVDKSENEENILLNIADEYLNKAECSLYRMENWINEFGG
jgi:hypothetical protein